MTDHKTVREALEYLRDWQPKDGADVVVETATEALSALDRIESQRTALQAAPEVEPVHAEILASAVYHATKGTSYNHILNTINGIAALLPNGLRIVKEK